MWLQFFCFFYEVHLHEYTNIDLVCSPNNFVKKNINYLSQFLFFISLSTPTFAIIRKCIWNLNFVPLYVTKLHSFDVMRLLVKRIKYYYAFLTLLS